MSKKRKMKSVSQILGLKPKKNSEATKVINTTEVKKANSLLEKPVPTTTQTKAISRTGTKKTNRKFSSRFWTALKTVYLMIIVGVLVATASGIALIYQAVVTLPSGLSADDITLSSNTKLYDMYGNIFATLGVDEKNLEKVTYDQLPEVLIDAILATEDRRFFSHNGVDYPRFLSASMQMALTGGDESAGGASSLTMQLSKLYFTETDVSIERKIRDLYVATFILEAEKSKEEIFEDYVNGTFLGNHAYGVQAASQAYFSKNVQDLNLLEASYIAGLFQSPSGFDAIASGTDAAQYRRNQVLDLMLSADFITQEEHDEAINTPIANYLNPRASTGIDPVYQDYTNSVVAQIKKELNLDPMQQTMNIYTNLDPAVQQHIDSVRDNAALYPNEKLEMAVTVIDNATGRVRGVIGGRNTSVLGFSFADSPTHPGSTFKPIAAYGPCFEFGGCTSASNPIMDERITYSGGTVELKNADLSYKGMMNIHDALVLSRNTPALRAFRKSTNEQTVGFINGLGIHPELDANGILGESAAVGAFNPGATPTQMAGAYSAFANGGTYREPSYIDHIEVQNSEGNLDTISLVKQDTRAMSPNTAYMINSILDDSDTMGFTLYLGKYGANYAAKTGTSTWAASAVAETGSPSDVRDSWTMTYTPQYTTALWLGYSRLTIPYVQNGWYLGANGPYEAFYLSGAVNEPLVTGPYQTQEYTSFPPASSLVSASIEGRYLGNITPTAQTPAAFISGGEYTMAPAANPSVRFDAPNAPTSAAITSTTTTATVTWGIAQQPRVFQEEYLNTIFNANTYDTNELAAKYKNQYLTELNNTFGGLGYNISIKNNTNGQTINKRVESLEASSLTLTLEELKTIGSPKQISVTIVCAYAAGPSSGAVTQTANLSVTYPTVPTQP